MTDFVTGRDTTAEQLLWLLNDRQTVPLDRTRIAVITGTYTPEPDEPADWPFHRGEVIPVESVPSRNAAGWHTDYNRELFGQRRTFEPWDMFHVVYTADDVVDAIEVADLAASHLDGYYEHFQGHWRMQADQAAAYRRWCSTLEPLRIGDYERKR